MRACEGPEQRSQKVVCSGKDGRIASQADNASEGLLIFWPPVRSILISFSFTRTLLRRRRARPELFEPVDDDLDLRG